MDEFAEKTSGRKKIGAASKWRNVQAAAAGGGSGGRSQSTVDAKPVASSMSAEGSSPAATSDAGAPRPRAQPDAAVCRPRPRHARAGAGGALRKL